MRRKESERRVRGRNFGKSHEYLQLGFSSVNLKMRRKRQRERRLRRNFDKS